jgi:hypothetical protein
MAIVSVMTKKIVVVEVVSDLLSNILKFYKKDQHIYIYIYHFNTSPLTF